nr:MAG TPA: hypothetical protein [Caudoviricetes sp.]
MLLRIGARSGGDQYFFPTRLKYFVKINLYLSMRIYPLQAEPQPPIINQCTCLGCNYQEG